MNRKRRNEIRKGIKQLDEAIDIITYVKEEEYDSMDSIEEHFENDPRCDDMAMNIDDMESAIDSMRDAKDILEEMLSN